MGSQCRLRGGQGLGRQQDADRLPKVRHDNLGNRRQGVKLIPFRFFIHKSIKRLAASIVEKHSSPSTTNAMLFPTPRCAARCHDFLCSQNSDLSKDAVRVLEFVPHPEKLTTDPAKHVVPRVCAVLYPREFWPTAKVLWQHTGEGISSRRAEFCEKAFDEGTMVEKSSLRQSPPRLAKGPRRYQRPMSVDIGGTNGVDSASQSNGNGDATPTGERTDESTQFVEERFGRNMSVAFAAQAKLAIRKRIAGFLTADEDLPQSLEQPTDTSHERTKDVPGFSVEDVYLHASGMNAIFTSHRILRLARGELKSIMYGFPYVDTLKILEKFGAGAHFYGHGNAADLEDLETRLENGERFLALYCEFPGNPLLRTSDLKRIRQLADKFDFAVVVDETIGNFLNIHVLPYADIVVSSLTKLFSGDSNVMGGSLILNPESHYYSALKTVLAQEYEDLQFEEDSLYLERNSRDFVSRISRINANAETIAETLIAHPRVKQVYYPKYGDTRAFYDDCRLPNGGYGGLLSATFYSIEDAAVFYDNLDTQKGPSLGTNFTLSSPFVILAHYTELDWAAQFGVEASLVRFSVGLEENQALKAVFERALEAIPQPKVE